MKAMSGLRFLGCTVVVLVAASPLAGCERIFGLNATTLGTDASGQDGDAGGDGHPSPSCSDGAQNQDETGVDCGGSCPPCSAPACAEGATRRCWVECTQVYSAGCIHAGVPPLIMGVETCAEGAWGVCATPRACTSEIVDACANGSTLATTYQCMDGMVRIGGYDCVRPLGAQCGNSYYGNWPVNDCPDLCLVGDDACAINGAQRPCEAHCDSPGGPTRVGSQTCAAFCGGPLAWGPCSTDDGCLN